MINYKSYDHHVINRYGVKLQAEPDNERLGKRLKGDFKRVAPAVKALSDEQLVTFQSVGTIEVEGHELTSEDIKVCAHFMPAHDSI